MIYKLKPNRVYRSYFGGKRLDALCGKEVCEDSQFPEEWVASTVTAYNAGREHIVEGPSVCENGELLQDVILSEPKGILGEAQLNKHGDKMSILVKLLDAAERLFIQCHPTVPFAREYFHSEFGKTECWYIISAEEDAGVYIGFKPEITREKWKEYFDTQNVDGMLDIMHRIHVKPGDLIFVEGGVPHAIGGGCLLCELQEPTDFMVIPERTSKSGITLADKKMHGGLGWERMFDCYIYQGYTESEIREKYIRHPELIDNQLTSIVDEKLTDKFRMDCLNLTNQFTVDFGDTYTVAVVISGSCNVQCAGFESNLTSGNELFISANTGKIQFDGNATIIFCRP